MRLRPDDRRTNMKNIKVGDKIKNLITGVVNTITFVAGTTVIHDGTTFSAGVPYAVTATMRCKVLNTDFRWEMPGMTYVDGTINVMQVRF